MTHELKVGDQVFYMQDMRGTLVPVVVMSIRRSPEGRVMSYRVRPLTDGEAFEARPGRLCLH